MPNRSSIDQSTTSLSSKDVQVNLRLLLLLLIINPFNIQRDKRIFKLLRDRF